MKSKTELENSGIPRREFIRLSGLATAGIALGRFPSLSMATPYGADPTLLGRGSRTTYRGSDLRYIGMPIGGVCAGQVYLGGDGRLWLWDIFNQIKLGIVSKQVSYRGGQFAADGGANYIQPPDQVHPFNLQFSVNVDGKSRLLDATGWQDVSFTGEYPIGFVEYRDPEAPVSVTLEAFSPFVPLDAEESGLPAVTMTYRIRNDSSAAKTVTLTGSMENPVGIYTVEPGEGLRRNQAVGNSRVIYTLEPPPQPEVQVRSPIVFEDWTKAAFDGWTVTGTAFGNGPIKQGTTSAARSYRLEPGDTNVQGDARVGKLVSREFTIDRRFIEFWISGGNHPATARINLRVEGKIVRTATGRQTDMMRLDRFGVEEFAGKKARLEIVDEETGFWGQIAIGAIRFVDSATETLKDRSDVGDMTFAMLDPQGTDKAFHSPHSTGQPFPTFSKSKEIVADVPNRPLSNLSRMLFLSPGEEKSVTFVIAWRFPNLSLAGLGRVGNHYATRFASSTEVVDHIRDNWRSLNETTRLWHKTWNDSTLPHWFLDRVAAGIAVAATMTVHRFGDGRFYGWEGVGGCEGTCGHVWGYAQSVGRMFPSLERTRREDVDYGICFTSSGMIPFRSEFGFGYAADAQAGYILRTYREHQMSADDGFLKRVYPRMKKALEFLIKEDANDNGVLEGRQHNTLDVDIYGPSSWLTSYYLAALRAGEEMAKETGDTAFATRCRTLFNRGSGQFNALFWNGEYYVQVLNKAEHPEALRYGNGCEIDQLMGQGWATQLGLGRIAPAAESKKALKALHKYNFLSDIGPYRDRFKPGRWYAMPGEPGMVQCTFPAGDRNEILGPTPTWASMYFNECWTGTEHQAAGHMVAEGLVEEGMAVVKAVHDRHLPSRRNPWNEVEFSDHYARSMAIHGVYLSACGYEHHGPKGHLGFAPRINPQDFRAAFTAAEGWGNFEQKIDGAQMTAKIRVRRGRLRLNTVALEVPTRLQKTPTVWLGTQPVAATFTREGNRVLVRLDKETIVTAGRELRVQVTA